MRVRVAGLLSAAVLLAACSGSSDAPKGPSDPPESSFAEGTCRTAAPDILSLRQVSRRLGNGPRVDAALKTQVREAQERLAELAVAAEPAYKTALDRLVESAGAVRIRADGNVYDPALGEQLSKDAGAAVDACT